MKTTVGRHYTQKEVDDLRMTVAMLRQRVEEAETQNLRNLEYLALAQERETLQERLAMLTHD